MKKLLFVLVLVMAVLVVNAQAPKTTPAPAAQPAKAAPAAQPTKTVIKVADLQKAITDNIAKDFAGFTIKEASSVTTNNVVTFEVCIVKGTTMETLVYDKAGKFLKKVEAKPATPPSPPAPPAPKK